MSRRHLSAGAALLLAAGLTACSSAASAAAEEAFEACNSGGVDNDLLHHDGKHVYIEVTGDEARAFAGIDDEIDQLGNTDDPDFSGMAVAFKVVLAAECLAEETGYPGSYDQLSDGEEWDGWRYSEEKGAGSEVTFVFTSTA